MKPLPPARESDIQKAVMDYLSTQGFVVFRRNTGAMVGSYKGKSRLIRFSKPGMADLWGWDRKTGRHIEVEVKRPGERPSPEQEAWLSAAQRGGVIAFWCDSVEDCRKALLVEFMDKA